MTTPRPVVVVGIGELGGVFARGLLRLGRPVFPITRGTRMAEAKVEPGPELVLVTVGEEDLPRVLAELPDAWRQRVGLVQNELLPSTWQAHQIREPTVCVVWFEKKRGREVHVVEPSIVFGPSTNLLVRALRELDIPVRAPGQDEDLVFELVNKNLYILTVNLAGLQSGGTVSDLWQNHASLAREVASEVLDIQDHLANAKLPRDSLMARLERAILADPDHQCTGRSAHERLLRALRYAAQFGLEAPRLRAIAAELATGKGRE